MSVVKKYCNKQFQWKMFNLNHENPTDFYLSCWQKESCSLVTLIFRTVLFLFSLAVFVTSLVYSRRIIDYYFIYLTHWGLILITIATGYSATLSAFAYYGKCREYKCSWYLQLYWIILNSAVGIAFLVTLFYWSVLTQVTFDLGVQYSINETLNIFIHGVNSLIMITLLLASRQPVRLMHFYHPLVFGILYLVFNVTYYFIGGTDPFGNKWIYPMLDWTNPGMSVLSVFGTAILMLFIHLLVTTIALVRDVISKTISKSFSSKNSDIIAS